MNGQPIVEAPRTAATGEAREETSADDVSVAKATATLQARLALRGFVLHRLPGGGFAISRWDQQRIVDSLPEVEAFARVVGA
jgi:hypothetical protein